MGSLEERRVRDCEAFLGKGQGAMRTELFGRN